MISRRSFVHSLLALPLAAPATISALPGGRRLRVLGIGAHPGDPESGCGGTLARYADAGHDVALLYTTSGEKSLPAVEPAEAARRRREEATRACAVLGARARFVGLASGALGLTAATTAAFRAAFDAESPDVVFTHWPEDTDWEHQVTALLTLRAYLQPPRPTPLFFYEVQTGARTMGFTPTAYVDVTATREKKAQALRAHASQSFERLYEQQQEKIEAFRGRELGVSAAEAFTALGPDARSGLLPGL